MADTELEKTLLEMLHDDRRPGTLPEPRLFEIFKYKDSPVKPTRLEWESYGGMGDYALSKVTEPVETAVRALLKRGELVRTFEEASRDELPKTIRRILPFNDVKFGYDTSSEMVAFDLLPDDIMPDKKVQLGWVHRSAITRVKTLIEEGHAQVDKPFRLTQGDIIRPILIKTSAIVDEDMAEIRRRQIDFNPL